MTDPQGNETLVSLFNVDLTDTPDPAVFQDHANRLRNSDSRTLNQSNWQCERGIFLAPAPCGTAAPDFLFFGSESDTAGLTNSPRSVLLALPDPSRHVSLRGASDLGRAP